MVTGFPASTNGERKILLITNIMAVDRTTIIDVSALSNTSLGKEANARRSAGDIAGNNSAGIVSGVVDVAKIRLVMAMTVVRIWEAVEPIFW